MTKYLLTLLCLAAWEIQDSLGAKEMALKDNLLLTVLCFLFALWA